MNVPWEGGAFEPLWGRPRMAGVVRVDLVFVPILLSSLLIQDFFIRSVMFLDVFCDA